MAEVQINHEVETVESRLTSKCIDKYLDFAMDNEVKFQHNKEEIKTQVQEIITKFQVEPAFFRSVFGLARPMLLLGVADRWISAKNLDEKKYLVDYMKVLFSNDFIQNTDIGLEFGKTFSIKEEEKAIMGYSGSYEFASGLSTIESVNREGWRKKRDFANDDNNTDLEKTASLINGISIDNPDSQLSIIRNELGITKENEQEFKVKVSKLTKSEMAKKFNGTIAFQVGSLVYLPNNFNQSLLEHEYTHSQQLKFSFGGGRVLGSALGEALTEYQVQKPKYYGEVRKVLKEIEKVIPGFINELKEYGVVKIISKGDKVVMKMMQGLGASTAIDALALAPVSSKSNMAQNYFHGGSFFRRPYDVYKSVHALVGKQTIEQKDVDFKVFSSLDAEISKETESKRLQAHEIVEKLSEITEFDKVSIQLEKIIRLWRANREVTSYELRSFIEQVSKKFPNDYEQVSEVISKTLLSDASGNKYYFESFVKDPNLNLMLILLNNDDQKSNEFVRNLYTDLLRKSSTSNNSQIIDYVSSLSSFSTPEFFAIHGTEAINMALETSKSNPEDRYVYLSFIEEVLKKNLLDSLKTEDRSVAIEKLQSIYNNIVKTPSDMFKKYTKPEELEKILVSIKQKKKEVLHQMLSE